MDISGVGIKEIVKIYRHFPIPSATPCCTSFPGRVARFVVVIVSISVLPQKTKSSRWLKKKIQAPTVRTLCVSGFRSLFRIERSLHCISISSYPLSSFCNRPYTLQLYLRPVLLRPESSLRIQESDRKSTLDRAVSDQFFATTPNSFIYPHLVIISASIFY